MKVYLRDEADTGVKFIFSGCRGTVGTNSANAGVGGKGNYASQQIEKFFPTFVFTFQVRGLAIFQIYKDFFLV